MLYGRLGMQIAFFRNIRNYKQLCQKTNIFRGIVAECHIIDTIVLHEDCCRDFYNNFMRSHKFLMPYIYKTKITDDIWYGVLVKYRDKQIVVVMNGYQYPRFTGLALSNPKYCFVKSEVKDLLS